MMESKENKKEKLEGVYPEENSEVVTENINRLEKNDSAWLALRELADM